MTEVPTRAQYQGCLIGQALGDALGFVVEGQPHTFCRRYVEERSGGGSTPRTMHGASPQSSQRAGSLVGARLLRRQLTGSRGVCRGTRPVLRHPPPGTAAPCARGPSASSSTTTWTACLGPPMSRGS